MVVVPSTLVEADLGVPIGVSGAQQRRFGRNVGGLMANMQTSRTLF